MNNKKKKNRFSRKPSQLPGKGPNAVWFLLIFLCAGIGYLLWYNSVNRDFETLTYSSFITKIEKNQVKSIRVQGQHVEGQYKDGKMFVTYVAPADGIWDTLRQNHVDVEVIPLEKQSWIYMLFFALLPFFLLILFFYFKHFVCITILLIHVSYKVNSLRPHLHLFFRPFCYCACHFPGTSFTSRFEMPLPLVIFGPFDLTELLQLDGCLGRICCK